MDVRATEFAAAEAKARFSELLDRAEAGEEITIRRQGKVVARLAPAIDRNISFGLKITGPRLAPT
jgi:prevent-host-death family protein